MGKYNDQEKRERGLSNYSSNTVRGENALFDVLLKKLETLLFEFFGYIIPYNCPSIP